jgi:hypothetical protein
MNSPSGRSGVRTGVRVNLTLPPEVDHVLGRVAGAAGTGKASFVRELLIGMVPQLKATADALEATRESQSAGLAIMAKALRGTLDEAQQTEMELGKARRMVRKRK